LRNSFNRWRTCRITGEEFIRRFLQHVLPKGLHKVRYFGLWHPAKRDPATRARQLLLLERPASTHQAGKTEDAADRPAKPPGPAEPRICPCCTTGHLVRVRRLGPKQAMGPCPSIPVSSHHDRSRPRMRPSCNSRSLPHGCADTCLASRVTLSRLKAPGPGVMIDLVPRRRPVASVCNPSPDTQAANWKFHRTPRKLERARVQSNQVSASVARCRNS
jgi:hypothetical protein